MRVYEKEVEISYPSRGEEDNSISGVRTYRVGLNHTEKEDIYDLVRRFESEIFPGVCVNDLSPTEAKEQGETNLRNLLNIHNADGIRRREQIEKMQKSIESGKEILSDSGIPNVKTVKVQGDELLVFDGHHSCLAYILAGRELLAEIPYLNIAGESGKAVRDRELRTFFGPHGDKLEERNWKDYVINWQASEEKQLETRIQEDMGELADSLFFGD